MDRIYQTESKGILRTGLARLLQYSILREHIDTIEAPDDLDRAEWYRFLTP